MLKAEAQLQKDFPTTYGSASFEIPLGWFGILRKLGEVAEVEKKVRFTYLKAKYARLDTHTVVCSGLDGATRKALEAAEEASMVTCEFCGQWGRNIELHGWETIACIKCKPEAGYPPQEETIIARYEKCVDRLLLLLKHKPVQGSEATLQEFERLLDKGGLSVRPQYVLSLSGKKGKGPWSDGSLWDGVGKSPTLKGAVRTFFRLELENLKDCVMEEWPDAKIFKIHPK